MSEKAEILLSDFKAKGWKAVNLYERLFDLAKNPEDIYSFAKQFLLEIDVRATIFSDSLSYIDKNQFAELVKIALEILQQEENEVAESVIEYAGMQFPELLHDDLALIFEIKPNGDAYFADYPWRNLSVDKIRPFKERLLSDKTSLADKQNLFRCLLQAREPETVSFAFQYALDAKLVDSKNAEVLLLAYLEQVGFTKRNGIIQSYCPNPVKHFCFPKGYLINDGPIWLNKEQHPTWNLQPSGSTFQFGGIIQDDDNNPFIHLITLDPIPQGLQISGLEKLTLGMHIRELDEGIIFYQHDENGIPTKIGEVKEITEQYNDAPIKETQLSFADTPERWAYQDWGSSNHRENLFRLGGEPAWIQGAQVLNCPVCNEKMDFLMQLDTGLPDANNREVYFGSGGGCYIFWCDKTKVSGYVMQCT